jgi:hypothetical protein
MKLSKDRVVFGSLLSCALLSINVQAVPLTYNVSAGSNPAGVFSFLTQTAWSSGDISLPVGTIIGSTPLEIDLTLSGNVTLNDAPDGTAVFSYGLFYGFSTPLPAGVDAGTVEIELLENGVVLDTSPTSSPFGFTVGTFPVPEAGFGTGFPFTLPNNLVFNGVDIFVSDSAPNGVAVTDIDVGLPIIQGVPDISNTLPLLFLGCAALLGFGYRKASLAVATNSLTIAPKDFRTSVGRHGGSF